MRNISIILILLFTFSACEKKYQPREFVKISIEKFKIDSASIRAIEIVNDSSIVYASSNGTIGILTGNGKFLGTKKIMTDTIVPHFRAIAYTQEAVFALSIENPALLYRYKNNEIELVYKEVHDKVFYDSMKFFDELNGIAIGDPTDKCLSVLITRDGGKSWGKMDCENLPEIEAGEAAFAASNTNIAIVGESAWVVTGGLKARVFHTPDMGLTWKVYDTPMIQGKNSTGIYSVDFYNERQGIICGGDYTDMQGNYANKSITQNGGKTWEVVSENTEPKYVSCVQYVPNTQGKEVFAVSENGVFYSKSSGKTWDKVSDEGFHAIRFVDENTAWVSGNEVIAKMTIN
ncbi:oxidoreductase [Lutibacter sp.]|uniref:sialidase family protein n=1 Tax=Lutibacter sp. TaxID=1925666 RepID=UPI0035678FAB